MCVCMYACMYVCMKVCICIHKYIYMYIYIYTYISMGSLEVQEFFDACTRFAGQIEHGGR